MAVVIAVATVRALLPPDARALRARAEAAEATKDWPTALASYRALNRTASARGPTLLAEARAAMVMDLAAQAEAALARASEATPDDPEPWRLRLDILRAEGRTTEALRVGWAAYRAVPPGSRRAILRELTLALLLMDETLEAAPDARVDRWAVADPDDIDARIAQHRQAANGPRPGAPGPSDWSEALARSLARDPRRSSAREALIIALDELGESDRARSVLDAWPADTRDSRHARLLGRFALDLDGDPALAAASLERALADLPHDWRTRTLLARAYRALGRPADAARESASVAAIRERLDPAALVPRLASALSRPSDPRAPSDLAALCDSLGLAPLAQAWRLEAATTPARGSFSP